MISKAQLKSDYSRSGSLWAYAPRHPRQICELCLIRQAGQDGSRANDKHAISKASWALKALSTD